jgi:hypothetical protein
MKELMYQWLQCHWMGVSTRGKSQRCCRGALRDSAYAWHVLQLPRVIVH